MARVKLHIPGPVEVGEKTFRAFCSPMIGYRGQGFKDLYAGIQPKLQQLLYTKQPVYLSTSSAVAFQEFLQPASKVAASQSLLNLQASQTS